MNILILNWRDIKNPAGGGAEILTHEMAKRWVNAGHTVTQFSSLFPKAKTYESLDGVVFIRRGKWWTVHFWAFLYYIKKKQTFDIIIDEVHWFPFFAGLYAPKKTIALTCEVATKLFPRIMPYPLALFFINLEKLYLLLYRSVPTMVISPSTRDDIVAAGHDKNSIVILPMGITVPHGVKIHPKEKNPTLISVGRLNVQKGTLDLIDAFAIIHKAFPTSVLWLVGSGEETFIQKVKEKIGNYGLEKHIKLYGFISELEKFELLSKAHILVSASTQEGWGLTIPEAGIVKTPSIVYNIEGFRDIVLQNKTGVLVETNPTTLAREVIGLLNHNAKYKKMQEDVYKHSQVSSWEMTGEVSLRFITSYYQKILQ